MKKIIVSGIAASLIAGAFFAGIAVGKGPADKVKFMPVDELKWEDKGGPKLATISGDANKGPYTGLLKIPAGFTSPLHSHTGDYEAIVVEGQMTHWLKGEDGKNAKKLNPGSYWTIPGKLDHVSACAPGKDCVAYLWQKTKFDFIPGKEDKPAAGSGAAPKATGSGAAPKK